MRSFVILKENARDAALIAEYLKEHKCNILCATTNYLEALNELCRQKPDFAIIDTSQNDGEGLEFMRCVRKRSPQTYTIVCIPMEKFSIKAFLEYDVNGYLSLDHSLSELLECITSLQEGNRYVARKMIDVVMGTADSPDKRSIQDYDLSCQEQKVLQMMARGLSSKEITEKLFITIHTLNNHKTKIRNKLNLRSNRELVFFALQHIRNVPYYVPQA